MRIAIIGCGSIGKRHLKNALALGCDVYVNDRNEAVNAQALGWGARQFWSLEKTPVDAVMICTPWDTHLAMARDVIEARLPLFVEKPLGSLDQIEDWRRLVQASSGLTTQVGYQLRWQEKARELKAAVPNPRWIDLEVACDMRTWPGLGYGSGLLECSHELDLAFWLGAADLEAVTRGPSCARATFRNGTVLMRWHADEYLREWSASGEARLYHACFDAPAELGDQMYVDELDHFLTCVREGRQTDVPLADGLRVLEVCRQVEAMARQHA